MMGPAVLPMTEVFLLAYWTVLVAELVGDKSIYVISSLSLRYRFGIVFIAMAAAFGGKMLAAVLLGKVVIRLHSGWTDILSAAAFFISGLFIWFKEPDPAPLERASDSAGWRQAAVCFVSLFFTEWADTGQIAVAAMTVKSHSILAPWLGGTLAMITKGALAMTVGLKMRDKLPQRALRAVASGSCCFLGILALFGLFVR